MLRTSMIPELKVLWPEVFEDFIDSEVPFKYIDGIQILFKTGRKWEFSLDYDTDELDYYEIKENMYSFIEDHRESIEHVKVRFNIAQLKNDIQQLSSNALK